MKRKIQLNQIQENSKCQICKKREIEIYQLDYEVCFECHQNETYPWSIDQDVDTVV